MGRSKGDTSVKSSHAGENRSPVKLELFDKTGLSGSSENDKNRYFPVFYETVKSWTDVNAIRFSFKS